MEVEFDGSTGGVEPSVPPSGPSPVEPGAPPPPELDVPECVTLMVSLLSPSLCACVCVCVCMGGAWGVGGWGVGGLGGGEWYSAVVPSQCVYLPG